MEKRVTTGIPQLDDMIDGGFPLNSVILVSGGPGTGKTIFGCQYLHHGLENGENGVFITLEESTRDIREDAAMFNWDFEQYEDEDRLRVVQLSPFKDGVGFTDKIREIIEDVDATRVVIDSISVMGLHLKDPEDVRESIYDLVRRLKNMDIATLMTAEVPPGQNEQLSRYGVEEFVSDGVIRLTGVLFGADSYRTLQVVKMRKTDIDTDVMTLNISNQGLTVQPSAV